MSTNRREIAELLYLVETAKDPADKAEKDRLLFAAIYPLKRYEIPPLEKDRIRKLLDSAPTEEARFAVCRHAVDRLLDGTPVPKARPAPTHVPGPRDPCGGCAPPQPMSTSVLPTRAQVRKEWLGAVLLWALWLVGMSWCAGQRGRPTPSPSSGPHAER